jgi:sodium-coupled neutral amino acid transporter 7/8
MASVDMDAATESTALLHAADSSLSDHDTTASLSPSKAQPAGISWYFAVFLIVNAALGAGLLNFGKAYDNAGGVLISTLMQAVLVSIIFGALLILAYLTDNNKSANFQDVVYGQCGKRWQTVNSLCIIFYMFGCCVTFFIIIGDQLDQSKLI